MKGVNHYTKDGEQWKGGTHKMDDGKLHSGKTHTENSQALVHKDELDDSPAPFKLREVNSPMKCWKTHRKVGMKKSPSGRKKNGKVVMVNDCKKR
tara:strand:- start:132 stop:416 length:285 start_codon:yes stop_codon:yes gene_type:complete